MRAVVWPMRVLVMLVRLERVRSWYSRWGTCGASIASTGTLAWVEALDQVVLGGVSIEDIEVELWGRQWYLEPQL